MLSAGSCTRKIYRHFTIFLEYGIVFSLALVHFGKFGGTEDIGGLHTFMVKIEGALFRGFHLDVVLLSCVATFMSKLNNSYYIYLLDTPPHNSGGIHLEHLWVLINSVGVLCFGITHAGILTLMKHMIRSLENFVVGLLIYVKCSTLVDHQMIAADIYLQDGVSKLEFIII